MGLLSSYLYTNADDTQKHLTIKLVLAISNYKKKSNNQDTNKPISIYKNAYYIILLNNWKNSNYFIVF